MPYIFCFFKSAVLGFATTSFMGDEESLFICHCCEESRFETEGDPLLNATAAQRGVRTFDLFKTSLELEIFREGGGGEKGLGDGVRTIILD